MYKGAADKILFYFQGGGACWDQNSLDNSGYGVKNTYCRTDAIPWPVYGVFDVSDPRNPYRDYTIINVLYCSGDNHAGNAVRNFTDANGYPAVQKGSINVESVLTWLQMQQSIGDLASTLENLVVMGCSAGSLASQLWGNEIVKRLDFPKRAAIVLDSYIGLFPPEVEGELVYSYGMCDLSFLSEYVRALCNSKQANTTLMTYDAMQSAPNVPYLFLHSRTDRVQIKYFNYLVDAYGTSQKIDETSFVQSANSILEKYNELPNFLVYYVDSSQHCFTPTPFMFFADTNGIASYDNDDPDGEDVGGGGTVQDDDIFAVNIEDETMNKWLTRTPLGLGKKLYSQCSSGLCSENLVPKEYRQQGLSSEGSGGKGSGESYIAKSDYEPSIRVKQMHGIAHLDSEFNSVDSTFNVTHVEWNTYTASLVTVPVLIYTVGLFCLLVFLFFLCFRSRQISYSRFDERDTSEELEQYGEWGVADKENSKAQLARARELPKTIERSFLACMGMAFLLNLLIFVGNHQLYRGTLKGDDSLSHLQSSFLQLEDISDSLLYGAQNLSDVLIVANNIEACSGINAAVYYLGDYENYAYEFGEAVDPVEPKVQFARETVDKYAVEKKNGLVFTIFTVITVSLLLFCLSWYTRSVGMTKLSIGMAVFVTFLGMIFATMYMVFLVSELCICGNYIFSISSSYYFAPDCFRRLLHGSLFLRSKYRISGNSPGNCAVLHLLHGSESCRRRSVQR